MAKTMVVAGKIGPAFGGTHVTAYGSVHARETNRLDEAFSALEANAREGMAWYFYTYPLAPVNLRMIHACQVMAQG